MLNTICEHNCTPARAGWKMRSTGMRLDIYTITTIRRIAGENYLHIDC
jgi:hypothetical protein